MHVMDGVGYVLVVDLYAIPRALGLLRFHEDQHQEHHHHYLRGCKKVR